MDPINDPNDAAPPGPADAGSITRRATLQGGAAVLATISLATEAGAASPVSGKAPAIAPLAARPALAGQTFPLHTTINGKPINVEIDARTSLLDLLRERVGLTGAKKGCDHGQCGACTVHIDGKRVVSCLTLAAKTQDRAVTTIEGLSNGEHLHPMQQAFIDHEALQCGYCTPGQIMSAVACVREGNATSKDQIREYMSGNICRCGAYVGIVAAVEDAAAKMGTVA